jgi:Sec-independent protein secretion pathway component TatC
MTGLPLILILVVLIAAIFAAASVIFTPIWAVPLGLVLIVGIVVLDFLRRQRTAGQEIAAIREDAKPERDKVEFTERDKETLA